MKPPTATAEIKVNKSALRHVIDKLKVKAEEWRIFATGSVGIHETEGAQPKLDYQLRTGKLDVFDVMSIHEHGSRPWLSNWFDTNKQKLQAEAYAPFRDKSLAPREKIEAFKSTMIRFRDDIKSKLQYDQLGLRKLEEPTVKAKQRAGLPQPDEPLIATKQSLQSIRAKANGEYVE